jgi:hypothetical protein
MPGNRSDFGNLVLGLLFLMLVGLGLTIGIIGQRILSGISDPAIPRLQALVADVLVPMFEAVLTALLGTGILKGLLTVADNQSRASADKEPIKIFDW